MKNEIKNFVSEFSIDQDEIKKVATEAARKAITKEVEEFYLGYNSPFRKEVRRYLEENQPSVTLDLPDYAEIINSGLTAEIDKICSEISVKNFAHSLRKALTGVPVDEDGCISITGLGKMFGEHVEFEQPDDGVIIKLEDNPHISGGYLDVVLIITEDGEKREYHFSLIKTNIKEQKYSILSMPFGTDNEYKYRNIRVKTENNTIVEIPSFAGVHSDESLSILASILIHNIPIKVDTYYFEESDPEDC